MKYLFRILGAPFLLILLTLAVIRITFVRMYLFIRYGGEWITYDKKINKKTIGTYFEKQFDIDNIKGKNI